MMQLTQGFAATETAESGMFEALGIDWRLLILQGVAFVILVWFLGKFVYPHLIKAIDRREERIAESVAAAEAAEEKAESAQAEVEALLKKARTEAAMIVDTAHKEAAAESKEVEERAKKRADQIVSDARAQLDQDIARARKQLRDETTELVALATEKIIGEKLDAARDTKLIKSTLEGAK